VVTPPPQPSCSTGDSDHDGVNDCDDKCPNTAKGIKVDEYGCPIRIELKGVNFKYDSAELTPTALTILDKVAVDLGAYPVKKNIEVRGHASSEGTNEYNLRLSQRRSQSVADYLKRKGVTNKLIAKGYGEEYPIADNSTEAGREKNRRVELVWTGE
jgi:OOP family OmpA-OmpF porin